MQRTFSTALLLASLLVGCSTTMQVNGIVTDVETGRPIGTCQITMGDRYAHSDPAGHYSLTARRSTRDGSRSRPMNLKCDGYQLQSVIVDSTHSNRPVVNVQVVPTGK